MKTYAPSFINSFAVASPMPLLPPVTSAIFPSSLLIYLSFAAFGRKPYSVDRWSLSNSVLCNQHHAEPRFALHHASVSISSLFNRNCLDHRADIFQHAERKCVLALNRRASQCPVDRASSKDERDRTQLDLVLRYTDHDGLAAGCKTGHKWPDS